MKTINNSSYKNKGKKTEKKKKKSKRELQIPISLHTYKSILILLITIFEEEYPYSSLVRGALIALGEQAKCINLLYEIEHACPSTKPESHNQNPYHYKGIHGVHASPAS